jgi:RNA recognition motif-containing protein
VKLLKRHDGKSKGRGFVKFYEQEAMDNALKLDGSEMMGRHIVV